MRSSQEMLGWPLAAKRFAQNVLPEPDIPTRAIRNTGDDWLAMSSSQYDIAWSAHRQVFPATEVAAKTPTRTRRTRPSLVCFPVRAGSLETFSIPKRLRDRVSDQGHSLPSGNSRAEQEPALQTASRTMPGGTC